MILGRPRRLSLPGLISHTVSIESNGVGKSTPPQNRELTLHLY